MELCSTSLFHKNHGAIKEYVSHLRDMSLNKVREPSRVKGILHHVTRPGKSGTMHQVYFQALQSSAADTTTATALPPLPSNGRQDGAVSSSSKSGTHRPRVENSTDGEYGGGKIGCLRRPRPSTAAMAMTPGMAAGNDRW